MSRSRRVLLVNPVPLYGGKRASGAVRMQPGLVSIFSFLQAHDVSVEVLDLHLEVGAPRNAEDAPATTATCVERVLARDFDLLALSCNSSFHYLGAIDLAVALRAADPHLLIVVGGCHASAVPGDFSGPGSPFDVVVRGEGELELLELALPLDTAWTDFTGYPYWKPRPHALTFPLSRGCPFSCVFCGGSERRAWRAYPLRVARGIAAAMVAAGPEVVGFSDACFGLRPAWRRPFLDELRGLRAGVVYHWETRADTLSPVGVAEFEGLDLLLDVGLESASARMIEVMGKAANGRTYLRRARRLLEALGSRRVPTQVNLLLNHPAEDEISFNETMHFAVELAERSRELCAYPSAHAFMQLPGTAIANDLPSWERDTGTRIGHPEWWRERGDQSAFADDVVTAVAPETVRAAVKECQKIRGRAVTGMPVEARLTWRRVRAPLRLPESTVAALHQVKGVQRNTESG